MANYHSSSWPEPEGGGGASNWMNCNAAIGERDSSFIVPWHVPVHQFSSSSSATFQYHGIPSLQIPIEGFVEDRAERVSKSHSQAEKRRRDRINAQLATLRKLIPKSDKMDKAALLGSVIEHVKDLKRKATDVSESISLPTEVDEVTVDCDPAQDFSNPNKTKDKNIKFIKASVCCDDRPELFTELIRVLKSLRLVIVRADIVSVGGRTKSILLLCNKNSKEEEEGSTASTAVSLSTLKQSLSVVLNRIASSSVASTCRIRSKRQRFFLPSHHHHYPN